MAMSDFLENALLKHITNKEIYTPPVNLYIGLYTDIEDGETGKITEVMGASYNRVKVVFGEPINGAMMNTEDVVFNIATEDWGIVKGVAIYDDIAAGNLLFYSNLTSSQAVNIDNQIIFKIGKLSIAMD